MAETTIEAVRARQLWDSRGRPTVEAEIEVTSGAVGRAIAPAGASTGSGEAVDLRDGGDAFGGFGVGRAVEAVTGPIATSLRGLDAQNQAEIDGVLLALDGTPDKSRVGGNAMIATSMAVAQAAAAAAGVPLWEHLAGEGAVHLPLPEVQIFGGGVHAGHRVDVQDFMVIAVGAAEYGESLEWIAAVHRAAGSLMHDAGRLQGVADEGGYWPAFDTNDAVLDMIVRTIEAAGFVPGDEVAISLDVAATELVDGGRYVLGLERRRLDSDGLSELLLDWIARYPIVAIEDPLAEDDVDALARFTKAAGSIAVVGDDAVVTNADRVHSLAAAGACNAALIKPNQAGTLTETKAAFDAARAVGWMPIVSARSGESEDVTVMHLAVGWGAPMLKVGSITRSERTAKWNEGIRIAERIGPVFASDPYPWSGA